MKQILKKLIAVTMSAAMIISFISETKLKAATMSELYKTGNIILYENKAGGIVYNKTGTDVNIYQIAKKGKSGFELDSKYKDFFGNIAEVVSYNQQVAYAKYDTASCSLKWSSNFQEYDFKFDWKGVVLDKNNLELEFLSMGINTFEESTRLSECLHNYCNNKKLGTEKVNLTYTDGGENNEGYYKYNNLIYGYYLIDMNIEAQNNQIVGMPSILVTLDDTTASQEGTGENVEMNLRIHPKGKLPTITKYIYRNNAIDGKHLVKSDAFKTDEEITYVIVYDVPDLRNMTVDSDLIYKVYDKMDNQTFKDGSLKLSIRKSINDIIDQANKDYYIFKFEDENGSLDDTEKKNFSVQLTEKALNEIKANSEKWSKYKIVIEYVATLDSDAKFENNNMTYLKYANNKTEKAITQVYTYKMNIHKKFSDGSTDFNGIEFKLFDEKKEKVYKFKKAIGTYTHSNSTSGTTDILKPNSEGKINIFGLDAGTYWLVETKTKPGFEAKELKVTINPNFGYGTSIPNLGIVDDEKDYVSIIKENLNKIELDTGVNVEVVNRVKGLLPETGSIGTIIFTLVGLALITLAISMFRKNNKNK